jgi:hypothetical protein
MHLLAQPFREHHAPGLVQNDVYFYHFRLVQPN